MTTVDPEQQFESGDDSLETLLSAADRLLQRAQQSGQLAPFVRALEQRARELEASDETLTAEPAEGGEALKNIGEIGRFGMIGRSPEMQAVFELIERVAGSDVSVLVQGETGTGKELVAHALHANSRRAKGPFIAVNCAAVPAGLLESELFGHVKGAFTGAVANREGQFAAADGGTIFLDEIGDMPLDMQVKLLRVLQEREVRAVGGNAVRSIDVRVISATHRDLESRDDSGEGAFREDLFYRLAVVRIALPSLAERRGDVELLAVELFQRLASEMGRSEATLEPAAIAALAAAPWPGNVRQLENELRRALALSSGSVGLDDLSPDVRAAGGPAE